MYGVVCEESSVKQWHHQDGDGLQKEEVGSTIHSPLCLSFTRQDLDMVEEYNWKTSTGCINRARAGSASYKSWAPSMCNRVMEVFYHSVSFAVVCSGSSIKAGDTNSLNKLIRKAGPLTGCKLDTFIAVMKTRHLKNHHPSWIILRNLCMTYWTGSRAPSLTDWFNSAVTKKHTGNLSYRTLSSSITQYICLTKNHLPDFFQQVIW